MEAIERTRIVTSALDLIETAAKMLDLSGEMQMAMQIRGVIAAAPGAPARSTIRHELRVPLALTGLALAILDDVGEGSTGIACDLQSAIDRLHRTGIILAEPI